MGKQSFFIKNVIDSVSKYGDRTAIVDCDGERRTSFTQFLELSRKVAGYISGIGLKHSFICLKFANGRDFIAAELGVWLSGNAAVPDESDVYKHGGTCLFHCPSA